MDLREWFRPPRHLLVMFFGITLVSTAALGWLGWQFVRQDRALASQRAQERRENAAGLAVASLEQQLSEVDAQLTALANLPAADFGERALEYSERLGGGSALVVFRPDRIEAYPSGALVYYPFLPPVDEISANVFAEAEAIEFQDGDYARAVAVLRDRTRSRDPFVRAGAFVRLARNLRKAGRWDEAMATYEALAQLGAVPAGGIPSGLLARGARAALLEAREEHERLRGEATALHQDLHSGRWRITRPVFEFYSGETDRWLGSAVTALPDSDALALSEAVESLWDAWQNEAGLNGRKTFWAADQSILLVERSASDRMVALAVGAEYLRSRWLSAVQPVVGSLGVRISLSDAAGRPVVGPLEAPEGQQSLRLASETRLPWTLHAASLEDPTEAAVSVGSQLVVAGLLAIALIVLGGGYLIGRAVARELAVSQLQSDFVAAVSHEFRTPLTALRQLSELLAKGRVNSEEVRQQYYEVLQAESERLQRLVEGLLKLGRMEAGAIEFQFEEIQPARFLETLVGEFTRESRRHDCHVELNANGPVASVRADREALGYVIWNLLDNAVKYSPDCPSVWVDLVGEKGRVAIRVRDRGMGIPKEDQRRIFEKFVRGESAKTLGVPGTGVGLALAHEIMVRHGGEIGLESEPGAGSTFTILLPSAKSS